MSVIRCCLLLALPLTSTCCFSVWRILEVLRTWHDGRQLEWRTSHLTDMHGITQFMLPNCHLWCSG